MLDAVRPVRVSVTGCDCSTAQAKKSTNCALARAVKREYHADGAIIGISYSYIIKGDKAVRFKTPNTVSREITSFDRHKDFAPGYYGLSPVSPSNRLGVQREKRSGPHNESRVIHKRTVRVREME